MSWDALGYFDPDKPSFVGHDLIDIDWRGQGRSDGVSTCSGLHDYTGEINSWRLSSAATAAAKACIAKADPAQFALLLDHSVFAADVVALFDSSLTPILPGLIAGLAETPTSWSPGSTPADRPASTAQPTSQTAADTRVALAGTACGSGRRPPGPVHGILEPAPLRCDRAGSPNHGTTEDHE